MSTEVTLPVLGESVTEGTISRWLKAVGDTVEVDEPLLEVSTDKVDTEIPSPVAGTLLEIKFNEDDVAAVGAVLAVLVLLRYLVLNIGQGLSQDLVGRLRILIRIDKRFIRLSDINVTITVWIFLQVILVIFLRHIEVLERKHLNDDFLVVFFLLLSQDLFDYAFFLLVRIVNSASILDTSVISLLVQACRIDHFQIIHQQPLQGYSARIVSHLYRLGMTAVAIYQVLIRWILSRSVRITAHGVSDPVNSL